MHISMPESSSAALGTDDVQAQYSRTSSAPTPTAISRQNVAEITWPSGDRINLTECLDAFPTMTRMPDVTFSESSATTSVNLADVRQHLIAVDNSNAPLFTPATEQPVRRPSMLGLEAMDEQNDEATPFAKTFESEITYFPVLRTRHCTNDWLTPPADLATVAGAKPADLYRLGVDAHLGTQLDSSSMVLDEIPVPRPCSHYLFGENPFVDTLSPSDISTERRATDGGTPLVIRPKRLGTSIGSASHRRRSYQHNAGAPFENNEGGEGHEPGLMERIRKGSIQWTKNLSSAFQFHRNEQLATIAIPESVGESSPEEACGTPHPTAARPTSAMERTPQIINSAETSIPQSTLDRLPPLPVLDNAGIYEAMTGARRSRGNTCSEDSRPHVCELSLGQVESSNS
jgi:hypothetical protein